jgi:hypothetical protein
MALGPVEASVKDKLNIREVCACGNPWPCKQHRVQQAPPPPDQLAAERLWGPTKLPQEVPARKTGQPPK